MAKRMKLIGEAEYANFLASRKSSIPVTRKEANFIEKQEEAADILNLNLIPDDIKLALFCSVVKNVKDTLVELQSDKRKVHVTNLPDKEEKTYTSSVSIPETAVGELNVIDQYLVDSLPETFRAAATRIIIYLKNVPGLISWTSDGACTFDGKFVEGSNIVDLLSYVLRPDLTVGEPKGANRFAYILKVLSVPLSILGHKRRHEIKIENQVTSRKKRTDANPSDSNWIDL